MKLLYLKSIAQPMFLQKPKLQSEPNILPFCGTVQHVKYVNLMLQCGECNLWRLIFSKHQLNSTLRQNLQCILNDYNYTCGASLAELHLPEEYANVEIRDHQCYDLKYILYYSAKFSPICIYCGVDQGYKDDNEYPKCDNCTDRSTIYIKVVSPYEHLIHVLVFSVSFQSSF